MPIEWVKHNTIEYFVANNYLVQIITLENSKFRYDVFCRNEHKDVLLFSDSNNKTMEEAKQNSLKGLIKEFEDLLKIIKDEK